MAALLFGVPASSQITVSKSGQTQLGTFQEWSSLTPLSTTANGSPGLGGGDIYIPSTNDSRIDTAANLCIFGRHAANGGGRITFGQGSDVYIGEQGKASTGMLALRGANGIRFSGRHNAVFTHDGTRTGKFTFNVPVDATAFNTTSDARLKRDVAGMGDVFAGLNALNPVTYRMAGYPIPADTLAGTGEEALGADAAPDDRLRYGFIAQEVMETFPELVSENSYGYLSVDYIGFIPMLVSAVQEMDAKIKEQEAVIESLTARENAPQRAPGKDGGQAGIDGPAVVRPSLAQNRPNPFTATTVIECTLPESVADASLRIYDLQGKQVMKLAVEGRGSTSVTVDGSTLAAGMYIYALIADGREIDSKRMILTD